jgi:hypothetical protein
MASRRKARPVPNRLPPGYHATFVAAIDEALNICQEVARQTVSRDTIDAAELRPLHRELVLYRSEWLDNGRLKQLARLIINEDSPSSRRRPAEAAAEAPLPDIAEDEAEFDTLPVTKRPAGEATIEQELSGGDLGRLASLAVYQLDRVRNAVVYDFNLTELELQWAVYRLVSLEEALEWHQPYELSEARGAAVAKALAKDRATYLAAIPRDITNYYVSRMFQRQLSFDIKADRWETRSVRQLIVGPPFTVRSVRVVRNAGEPVTYRLCLLAASQAPVNLVARWFELGSRTDDLKLNLGTVRLFDVLNNATADEELDTVATFDELGNCIVFRAYTRAAGRVGLLFQLSWSAAGPPMNISISSHPLLLAQWDTAKQAGSPYDCLGAQGGRYYFGRHRREPPFDNRNTIQVEFPRDAAGQLLPRGVPIVTDLGMAGVLPLINNIFYQTTPQTIARREYGGDAEPVAMRLRQYSGSGPPLVLLRDIPAPVSANGAYRVRLPLAFDSQYAPDAFSASVLPTERGELVIHIPGDDFVRVGYSGEDDE